MGKKKLPLNYISDDTVRKATFENRNEVLMKKLDEITRLCDVDACAVIHNEFNSNPEVWPSDSGVKNILEKFEMLTERAKTCRSVNHEEFLSKEIAKVKKKTKKLAEENKVDYMRELMFGCLSGNMGDLSLNGNDHPDLGNFIDQYVETLIHHKNVTLSNHHLEIGESSSTNMAPTVMNVAMAPPAMAEAGSSNFMNSFQLTNDLPSIISSNGGLEHVSSLGSNYLNIPSDSPQVTSGLLPKISSKERLEHESAVASTPQTSGNQEVYMPVMNQDKCYYLNQNKNEQKEFVEEMLKFGEQTGFPWMEDSH